MTDTQPHFFLQRVCTARIAAMFGVGVLLSCSLITPAHAKIYTCVDAQGRKITSDRPITACLDREQKQMSSSGFVKRIIQPSYTAAELKEKERLQRQAKLKAAQERARQKTLTALLQRYPTPESLKEERQESAAAIETRIQEGIQRLKEIQARRTNIDNELAFYRKNPENAPRPLKLRKKSLDSSIQKSKEYIAKQRQELADLHQKFDNERDMLTPLWKP